MPDLLYWFESFDSHGDKGDIPLGPISSLNNTLDVTLFYLRFDCLFMTPIQILARFFWLHFNHFYLVQAIFDLILVEFELVQYDLL